MATQTVVGGGWLVRSLMQWRLVVRCGAICAALLATPAVSRAQFHAHFGHHHSGHHHHHHYGGSIQPWGSSFSFNYYSSYRPIVGGYNNALWGNPYGVYSAYTPYSTFSTGVVGPQFYGGWPGYGYSTGYAPLGLPTYSLFPPPVTYGGPIFVPAEAMYGPGAVRRFMGVDPPLGPIPGLNAPLVPSPPALANVPAAPLVLPNNPQPVANPQPRPINAQVQARALEQINAGDVHFRAGRYHVALQRYKDATTTAPELADGFMRQGWALLALGQFDVAARAMRKGLELKPDWHTQAFRLQELYPEVVAKQAHRDAIERVARDRDTDPNMSFLAGMFAWADRDMDRARGWFTKAKQHEIGDQKHIATFLSILPAAANAP